MLKWTSFAILGAVLYVTDAHPVAVGIYAACLATVVALELSDRRRVRA